MDKKELVLNLKKFKKKIEKKQKIEKIIFFGSRAHGKAEQDSDVDLLIVGNFKGKNNLHRAPPLYLEWEIDLPVDFLCYTPDEFKKLSKKISIVREALKNGIVIE